MKKQLQILRRLNAPVELIADFEEKCEINERLLPDLRASVSQLLEESCRKFGFEEILEDGWFFRPYRLSGAGHREDIAVRGTELEAATIEQAYRRGYVQGFAECRSLAKEKVPLKKMEARLQVLAQWRTRNLQKFESHPGHKERPTRSLFGGRAALPPKTRYSVLMRDGFKCVACGASAADGAVLEVDHILPVSKGGNDTLENLRALCRECNAGKSDQVFDSVQVG